VQGVAVVLHELLGPPAIVLFNPESDVLTTPAVDTVAVKLATVEPQYARLARMAEPRLAAVIEANERILADPVLAMASACIFAMPSMPMDTTIKATMTSTRLKPD